METSEAIRVLQAALRGQSPMDACGRRSVDVLEERLERLKRQSVLFEGVCFSEEVERLSGRSAAVAVN